MDTITQISQIILRSGPEIDLPGKTTNLTPLTFEEGLRSGEMAFTDDTGRIFIGHNPSIGQPQFDRLIFPWKNIEVLTENSTGTITKIISETKKEEKEDAYHLAMLPTHITDYENVILPRAGDETYVYRLPFSDSVSAVIEYCAFDANNKPVKMGKLSLTYFAGEAEPSLVDESTTMRKTGLLDPEVYQAIDMLKQVNFRFIVAGPVNAKYLAFQYKNRSGSVLSLRFKTSRSKV